MLNLRPYQKEALTSVKKSFKSKIHKQLLVLPTGAGKTCLFIAITQHYKRKTLILAHRNELIVQAYEKFKAFYPAADIGIYQGNQHNLDHQVIVSSIQTCNKRIQQLKEKGFKLELAVAGFDKKELTITYTDSDLTVQGIHEEGSIDEFKSEQEAKEGFVHKGIARRQFTRNFALGENIRVVGSKLENGILTIELEQAEEAARKTLKIS